MIWTGESSLEVSRKSVTYEIREDNSIGEKVMSEFRDGWVVDKMAIYSKSPEIMTILYKKKEESL